MAGASEDDKGAGIIEGRLILFDVDGTLVDSPGLIVQAIQQAFADCRMPPPSEEQARGVIGLSLSAAVAQLCPDPAKWGQLAEAYRRAWQAREHEVRLVPGMAELLARLRAQGAYLGIVTGKSRRGLRRMLRHLALEDFFNVTRTADDCPSKPHPAMVLECAEEMGVDAKTAIVVGDAVVDVQMARAAGACPIAVGWGCAGASALRQAGAHRVVAHIDQLEQVIVEVCMPSSQAAA